MGFRVVTTESLGSASIGDRPLGVLRSDAVSASPAHPASGMPRNRANMPMRDEDQTLIAAASTRARDPWLVGSALGNRRTPRFGTMIVGSDFAEHPVTDKTTSENPRSRKSQQATFPQCSPLDFSD